MRITVELLSDLRQHAPHLKMPMEVEVEDGSTVGELIARLGIPEDVTWNAAFNGKLIYAADPLVEGGALLVFAPLPGG